MTQSETHTPPIDVVKHVYDAFARLDLDAVLELADPDIVIVQDPALPWGGRHVGRDGVITFVTRLAGSTDSTVTSEAIFQAGENVIQYGTTAGTVRASGASFEIPECHIWTIRDGRVVEAAFFIDTASMLESLATT
jgi:ketosteroid isomerase-like protein